MIFDKFVKQKWQNRDPEQRKAAIEEIDDPIMLGEIAQHEESIEVRRAIVRKLGDLSLLTQISQQDNEAEIRELADLRFKQALCGQKGLYPPLDERLAWFNDKITDAEIIEYVAQNAQEPELRAAAVAKLERESLLGDIAIKDSLRDIRLAAAEKLTQKSTLERVHKATRNQDKYVSRIVRDKLEKLQEALERPTKVRSECEALCTKLEALAKTQITATAWEQEYAEYQRIKDRWQAIADEVEPACHDRYQQAEQKFLEGYQEYQSKQAERQAREAILNPIREIRQTVLHQLNAMTESLTHPTTITDSVQSFQERCQQLENQWHATNPVDDPQEEQHWQTQFNQHYQALQQHINQLQNYQDNLAQLRTLLANAKALDDSAQILRSKTLKSLQEQWKEHRQQIQPTEEVDSLTAEFNTLLSHLEEELKEQEKQRDKDNKQLKKLLKEVEKQLENGNLHNAKPLEREAKELLTKLQPTLPAPRYKSLEKRLQTSSVKIKELQDWQRWGNKVERNQLCEQMEALSQNQTFIEQNPEETARLIREAQKTWKNLGPSSNDKEEQTYWERFNNACNEAYKPCKQYFEEQSKKRAENFEKKQAICQQLEQLANDTDREEPDWKEIHRALRDIEKQWRSIGPTDRKARKQLSARYEQAKKAIETHLEQEKEANKAFRQDLIAQIKAAQAQEDLKKAIEEVKTLQNKWYVTVPGTRKEEKQLWDEFRKEGDKVFNRRKEIQKAQEKQRQDNLKAKKAICEQLESLAQDTGDGIQSAPATLKEKQEEWRKIGEVPKNAVQNLEKRYSAACELVQAQYQAHLAAEKRQRLDNLRRKAELCQLLENWDDPETAQHKVAEVQAQWAQIPALTDQKDEKAINQRFEKACQAALNNKPVSSKQALKNKKQLCIRLEIITGIDSPPEERTARMAYQVERLSAAMRGGEVESKDKEEEVRDIERHWYLSGPVPIDEQEKLNQRFHRALEAFYRSHA